MWTKKFIVWLAFFPIPYFFPKVSKLFFFSFPPEKRDREAGNTVEDAFNFFNKVFGIGAQSKKSALWICDVDIPVEKKI